VVGNGRVAPGVAAAFCAAAGYRVRVTGRSLTRSEAAAQQATERGAGRVEAAPLSRTTLADADIVVETVAEDAAVKKQVLATVASWVSPKTLITTNTSSLSLTDLATAVDGAGRFVGLHFLHPADPTELVEVTPTPQTASSTVACVLGVARSIGKEPILLKKEIAGFIWNRLQFALLRECLHLVDEGVADAAQIDTAVSDRLAPRWLAGGPLATADLGGLSTFLSASTELFPRLASGDGVSTTLSDHVSEGTTFYDWSPQELDAIELLRTRALAVGRELSQRRRCRCAALRIVLVEAPSGPARGVCECTEKPAPTDTQQDAARQAHTHTQVFHGHIRPGSRLLANGLGHRWRRQPTRRLRLGRRRMSERVRTSSIAPCSVIRHSRPAHQARWYWPGADVDDRELVDEVQEMRSAGTRRGRDRDGERRTAEPGAHRRGACGARISGRTVRSALEAGAKGASGSTS